MRGTRAGRAGPRSERRCRSRSIPGTGGGGSFSPPRLAASGADRAAGSPGGPAAAPGRRSRWRVCPCLARHRRWGRAGGDVRPVPGKRRGFVRGMRNELILLGMVPGGEGADVWRRLRGMSRRRSREGSAQPGQVRSWDTRRAPPAAPPAAPCGIPAFPVSGSSRHIAPDRGTVGQLPNDNALGHDTDRSLRGNPRVWGLVRGWVFLSS